MGGEEVENILCTTSLPWRPLPPSLLHLFPTHPLIFFIPPPLSGATTADKRDERERRRKRGGIDPPVQLPRFPPIPPFLPPCLALALGFSFSVLFVPSTSPFVDYSWEEVDGDALQYSRYIRYTYC